MCVFTVEKISPRVVLELGTASPAGKRVTHLATGAPKSLFKYLKKLVFQLTIKFKDLARMNLSKYIKFHNLIHFNAFLKRQKRNQSKFVNSLVQDKADHNKPLHLVLH